MEIKVKHYVEATEECATELYHIAHDAAVKVYPTAIEQSAGIAAAETAFTTKLNLLLAQAYEVGKKMGKLSADMEDTKMYSM